MIDCYLLLPIFTLPSAFRKSESERDEWGSMMLNPLNPSLSRFSWIWACLAPSSSSSSSEIVIIAEKRLLWELRRSSFVYVLADLKVKLSEEVICSWVSFVLRSYHTADDTCGANHHLHLVAHIERINPGRPSFAPCLLLAFRPHICNYYRTANCQSTGNSTFNLHYHSCHPAPAALHILVVLRCCRVC